MSDDKFASLGKDTSSGQVETQVGSRPGFGISMNDPNEIDPKARTLDPAGHTADIETGIVKHGDGLDTDTEDTDGADTTGDGGEETASTTDEAAKDTNGDLPDFEDKPEVIAKYEAKFIKDGAIDMAALSENFWSNAKLDANGQPEAKMPAGTHAFLRSKGLSDAMIEQGVKGQLALHNAAVTGLHARAGGKDKLEAALKWAREGGYDDATKARFNAIKDSGDWEAFGDAVDLLMTRHEKATAGAPPKPSPKPGKTSAQSETKEAAAGGSSGGFATREEWQKAFAEANASKDRRKIEGVREKLKRSAWHKGG